MGINYNKSALNIADLLATSEKSFRDVLTRPYLGCKKTILRKMQMHYLKPPPIGSAIPVFQMT
jgi:hypothetical protein